MNVDTKRARWGRAVLLGLVAITFLSHTEHASAQDVPSSNPGGAFVGAIAGGALGFIGGAHLGASGDCYEICGGILIGAVGGQILGVPLGAHLGNGGRGNLAAGLGASLVSVGIGIAGTYATSSEHFYLASMVAQVVAVTATEIRTSPDVSVTAGPRFIGNDLGVGVSIQW